MRVPLVPAFKQCVASNSNHVAPLAFGSCTPPVLESAILKTGTAVVSPTDPRDWTSSVQMVSLRRAPTTPVTRRTSGSRSSATDSVACGRRSGCTAAGADYTGQLIWAVGDSHHRPLERHPADRLSEGTGAAPCATATVTDITFSVPASCADNGGASGATAMSTRRSTRWFRPRSRSSSAQSSRYSESSPWTRARTDRSARVAASPARRSVAQETRPSTRTRASSSHKGPEANVKQWNGSGGSRSRFAF